jgi:hypothetical protein
VPPTEPSFVVGYHHCVDVILEMSETVFVDFEIVCRGMSQRRNPTASVMIYSEIVTSVER